MYGPCSISHLHSTELLVSLSPLPAIMCSWGGSNGPWLSFPPPLPFHFLITSPLPSLTGAQTRLSLCYSTFRSVPHFLAALRHDPAAAGNGHLQRSFLSLLLHAALAHHFSRPSLGAHTHLEQVVSSTLSVVRQLLSPLVTSSAPSTAPCSTLSGHLLYYPHPSHSGSRHSASSVSPRLTSLLLLMWDSQPISLGSIFLLLVCSGAISASRCHTVSYLSQQRRQEDGGWDRGTYCLSVCSSQTGSLNERSHPSSVATLCLFPLHHSPSPLCSSS